MKIFLSPSKRQEPSDASASAMPAFLKEAAAIHKVLAKYSPAVISKRLSVSAALAESVVSHLKEWSEEAHESGTPAMDLYRGDVYDGLLSETLSPEARKRGMNSLCILDAQYGLLMGGDAVLPHRLDLKDDVSVGKAKLTAYWKPKLAKHFKTWNEGELLLDLTSTEYLALLSDDVKKKAIRIDFKEEKGGALKTVSVFAKRARGTYARWILENGIDSVQQLKDFAEDGYRFRQDHSKANLLLFSRASS